MRKRVLFVGVTLVSLAAACSLTFSPGDYGASGGPPTSNDAAATGDAPTIGADGAVVEGGVPRISHLFVLAGQRDAVNNLGTEIADVYLGDVDAKGDITRWGYLQPAPYGGPVKQFNFTGGKLVALGDPNRVAELITFDPASGPSGQWIGSALEGQQFSQGVAQTVGGNNVLSFGGGGSVMIDAGVFTFQMTDTIRVAGFDPATAAFTPQVDSPNKLPFHLENMTVFATSKWIYVIGGDSDNAPEAQSSKVRVAPVVPAAGMGIGALTDTTPLTNPMTMQPYSVSEPIVCAFAGKLWIIGGASSDVILSAPLDDSTGKLGAWEAQAKLPGPLRAAGCAFFDDALYLVGGLGATSRTDRVIRSHLGADGKLGEWELSAGVKLPGPRSGIVAIAY